MNTMILNQKQLVVYGWIAFAAVAVQPSRAAPVVTIDDFPDNVTVSGTGFNTVSIPFVGTFQLFQTAHFADVNGQALPEAVWFAGLGGNLTTATANGIWTEQVNDPDAGGNSDRFFIQTTAPVTVGGIVVAPAFTVGVFLSDPNLLPSVTIPPVNLVVGNVTIPIFGGTTIDFNRLGNPVTSTEPNGYVNISPSDGLTVNARSDVARVPDSGATLSLLGMAVFALGLARRAYGRAFVTINKA